MKKKYFRVKIRLPYLLLAFVVGVAGFAGTWLGKQKAPTPYADVDERREILARPPRHAAG